MKRTDYSIKKGSEKIKFLRGVKINDKDTNLTIEMTLNHNKGLYTIQPKISTSEVAADPVLDKAMCKVVSELLYEATVYATLWRDNWLSNQSDDNDGKQTKMDMED